MGRLATKKRGIHYEERLVAVLSERRLETGVERARTTRLRPSWTVYNVAPCLVKRSFSADARGFVPVL
jgi:hypothetical protein